MDECGSFEFISLEDISLITENKKPIKLGNNKK